MVGHRHERLVAKCFQALGVLEKNLAGWGQFHRLAGAVEQTVAVLLLELADLCTDRRLRAENLLSGTRETALSSDFQEGNELIKVHCRFSEL